MISLDVYHVIPLLSPFSPYPTVENTGIWLMIPHCLQTVCELCIMLSDCLRTVYGLNTMLWLFKDSLWTRHYAQWLSKDSLWTTHYTQWLFKDSLWTGHYAQWLPCNVYLMLAITSWSRLGCTTPAYKWGSKVCRGDIVFMVTDSMLAPIVTYTTKYNINLYHHNV